MNKADVRPHSHGVNESMSNTNSDKKQSTKLRKHQQKCSVTTGRKKKKKQDCCIYYGYQEPVPAEQAPNFPIH